MGATFHSRRRGRRGNLFFSSSFSQGGRLHCAKREKVEAREACICPPMDQEQNGGEGGLGCSEESATIIN